ncbi:Rap1a/Tai family immunity protein [Massilia timonae]|uniref:Rap1a/Tai family immunity protein n=1 Tax=Massilia timonae TaxID=47229 RepID=UPI0028D02490|nr:Rap1a/Tai family immunity protein [Massilia timonae]
MEKRKAIVPKLGIAGALSVLVLAWPAPGAGAPQSPHVPAMTGEQFVRDMRPLPDSDLASIRRERAMGYMDGVLDGAAGVRWCPAGDHVPHELGYEAADHMRRLPPEQLKGSAATLAIAVVSKLYPCPKSGAKS